VFLQEFKQSATPNRLLAALSSVASEYQSSTFIRDILHTSFCTFARSHITPYGKSCPVHFTGGVAHGFSDILREVLIKEQLIPGMIHKSPLSGLISFHRKQNL
jgi:hypothetical protein